RDLYLPVCPNREPERPRPGRNRALYGRYGRLHERDRRGDCVWRRRHEHEPGDPHRGRIHRRAEIQPAAAAEARAGDRIEVVRAGSMRVAALLGLGLAALLISDFGLATEDTENTERGSEIPRSGKVRH